jgi:hypothetical protein
MPTANPNVCVASECPVSAQGVPDEHLVAWLQAALEGLLRARLLRPRILHHLFTRSTVESITDQSQIASKRRVYRHP